MKFMIMPMSMEILGRIPENLLKRWRAVSSKSFPLFNREILLHRGGGGNTRQEGQLSYVNCECNTVNATGTGITKVYVTYYELLQI